MFVFGFDLYMNRWGSSIFQPQPSHKIGKIFFRVLIPPLPNVANYSMTYFVLAKVCMRGRGLSPRTSGHTLMKLLIDYTIPGLCCTVVSYQ